MIWQVGQRRELKLRTGESCAFQSSTEAEERGWAEEEEEAFLSKGAILTWADGGG